MIETYAVGRCTRARLIPHVVKVYFSAAWGWDVPSRSGDASDPLKLFPVQRPKLPIIATASHYDSTEIQFWFMVGEVI